MNSQATRSAPTVSDLACKYAGNGPRYTSYPTAPQFRDGFDPDTASLDERKSDAPLSLYLHIPFCSDICYYCACNKIVTRERTVSRRYLDYLRTEIAMQSQRIGGSRPVTQLHWGGGTPTFLDDAELTELMHELASHFQLLDRGQREYSIEIDPRTVNGGRVALLRGLGFNRISLGIQDFDPLVQKSVNRYQPFPVVKSLVKDIRRHDFRSLSFDLIYGLPHQDRQTTIDTLEKVIALAPDRIACYNYAHLPERFPSQRAIDRLTLPSPQEKLVIQSIISEQLTAAGYLHIGLDHYVLPADDLATAQREGRLQRNFQGYSVDLAEDLLGLGVSAISQLGNAYLQNERNIDTYYTKLDRGDLPVARGCALGEDDRLRRHIIMQLACNLSLDIEDTRARYQVDFEEYFSKELAQLDAMAKDGLLEISADAIRVLNCGRPFLRNICMVFDRYLQSTEDDNPPPRYSATV
jgi:oxygen-independent coproporphyrinogen-3 oxidase